MKRLFAVAAVVLSFSSYAFAASGSRSSVKLRGKIGNEQDAAAAIVNKFPAMEGSLAPVTRRNALVGKSNTPKPSNQFITKLTKAVTIPGSGEQPAGTEVTSLAQEENGATKYTTVIGVLDF